MSDLAGLRGEKARCSRACARHLFTLGLAHVLDGCCSSPHVGSSPNPLWCTWSTPATLPATPTAQPRSLQCPAVVPPLAMAHVGDARTGASPCFSITLLVVAALLCDLAPFPFASWALGPGRCGSAVWQPTRRSTLPGQDDVGLLYGAGLRRAPSFAAASALR